MTSLHRYRRCHAAELRRNIRTATRIAQNSLMALPEALKEQLLVELGPEGSTEGLRLLDDMSVVRRPSPIFPCSTFFF
jgi:hypothetical protein